MSKKEWYSWNQIEKAWKEFVKLNFDSKEFDEAMNILSFWRFTHEKPLNIAFDFLQGIVNDIDKGAIYGKRLKRYFSIALKLKRFERMNLKNM